MSKAVEGRMNVRFETDAVRIGGEPCILLCASLFYFRIPRLLWKERMEQLKAIGYNSIDVYFPWNYHELREGEWDFEGERDADAFLKLAAETGLWVVARPGPYICSEWDGGGLPAYLLARPNLRLRDNDARFLRDVSRWFDRIMPILKANQAGEGGTVIAVQLDNELDFYGCGDPRGYMSALRDMALERGITVPLFACAGQGGIVQATGLADGVMPTCNFYPDNRDPELEAKVLHYRALLEERGYPLLVTETNRSHTLLRRLLSCGVKLLGPYLQVSGTDFGFTNATNNWGRPLAFLTSDYDFGGMISPEGHIREEAYEGRLLSRLIAAYGAPLARAAAAGVRPALAGQAVGVAGPAVLKLHGGGSLLFLTNLTDDDKTVTAAVPGAEEAGREPATITIPAGKSVALPYGVPLSIWGFAGTIVSSTAELHMAVTGTEGAALAFHAEGEGTVVLRLEEPAVIAAEHASAIRRDGDVVVTFDSGREARCLIRFQDGRLLRLIMTNRLKALYMDELEEDGPVRLVKPPQRSNAAEQAVQEWRRCDVPPALPTAGPDGCKKLASPSWLETEGIYRGYAWYGATVPSRPGRPPVKGVLIRRGSDVISLYADGRYAGTVVPGGSSRYVPLAAEAPVERLAARNEIWGHSNFDDIRLPGLRLSAMKGMKGMAAITDVRNVSGNWRVRRTAGPAGQAEPEDGIDSGLPPVVSFGGWLSADHPARECYSRTVPTSEAADSWTLHFDGLQSLVRLYVNGRDAGEVNPFDPYVDITPYVVPGRPVKLTVYAERMLGLPAGKVLLYEGVEAADWTLGAAGERELLAQAIDVRDRAARAEFPLELEPGGTAWLYGTCDNSAGGKGWRVRVDGSGLKLTVWMEGRIVGRIWTPGGDARPIMTGGSPDTFYLPGVWCRDRRAELCLWLEAVDRSRPGRLNALTFVSV